LFNVHAQQLSPTAGMPAGQLQVQVGPAVEQLRTAGGPTAGQLQAPAGITGTQLSAPVGLTVEHLRAPEQAVITDPHPEFGWIFPAEGKQQGSYRILVASAPFLLNEGKTNLWDSGIVPGNRSANISHGGSPLGPQSTCWWQAKVWSEDGRESAWSAPQQFNVAGYGSGLEENHWVELGSGNWVSKDVQRADFHTIEPDQQ
jgi:alpha-L-rhamnosidase